MVPPPTLITAWIVALLVVPVVGLILAVAREEKMRRRTARAIGAGLAKKANAAAFAAIRAAVEASRRPRGEPEGVMSERWPARIEFDERDAILHDGKGRAGVIACDEALRTDGLGAEIARRWNAYNDLVHARNTVT